MSRLGRSKPQYLSFLLLTFQGSKSWVHFAAIVSSCLSSCFIADAIANQDKTSVPESQISAAETHKNEREAELKALFQEYKQLQNSFDRQEEENALDEAWFRYTEANRGRGHCNTAYNSLQELKAVKSRRELRLKRIWLDIGKLKREMGHWDWWWYTNC